MLFGELNEFTKYETRTSSSAVREKKKSPSILVLVVSVVSVGMTGMISGFDSCNLDQI